MADQTTPVAPVTPATRASSPSVDPARRPVAEVVAYSEHPEDEYLSIKVVCQRCATEWGWRADTPTGNERLEDLAAAHNIEHHNHRRVYTHS